MSKKGKQPTAPFGSCGTLYVIVHKCRHLPTAEESEEQANKDTGILGGKKKVQGTYCKLKLNTQGGDAVYQYSPISEMGDPVWNWKCKIAPVRGNERYLIFNVWHHVKKDVDAEFEKMDEAAKKKKKSDTSDKSPLVVKHSKYGDVAYKKDIKIAFGDWDIRTVLAQKPEENPKWWALYAPGSRGTKTAGDALISIQFIPTPVAQLPYDPLPKKGPQPKTNEDIADCHCYVCASDASHTNCKWCDSTKHLRDAALAKKLEEEEKKANAAALGPEDDWDKEEKTDEILKSIQASTPNVKPKAVIHVQLEVEDADLTRIGPTSAHRKLLETNIINEFSKALEISKGQVSIKALHGTLARKGSTALSPGTPGTIGRALSTK